MQIYGKSRHENQWRIIDVFASRIYDLESRWPFCAGTCVTWGADVIAVGWTFVETLLREQFQSPASRDYPVAVAGGRIRNLERRLAAGGPTLAGASEILAHECGHTYQARRFGPIYLPLVGSVTLFREGPRFWNHFENQASEIGLFGGLVNGSVLPELIRS
jgi:hypothetical protein